MSKLHEIFSACYHGHAWVCSDDSAIYTSSLLVDAIFVHNQPGVGHACRAYIQSDSPDGSTGGKVWCFVWLLFVKEKSSVRDLIAEEHQLAKQDLQCRLKLAQDEQTERLKAVIYSKFTY